MDRWQALYQFWNQFWPAYDQYSVPDDATMPYITYEANVGSFEQIIPLTASLWIRSTSWETLDMKVDEIETFIKNMGCPKIVGGRYRVYTGDPFAQRSDDPADALIKRAILSVVFEFMI